MITIVAGAARGIGSKAAEFVFPSGESGKNGESEEVDSQAIEVIKRVGENASSSEEFVDALNGFSIESTNQKKKYTYEPEKD
ncbi:hypothetical protein GJ629_00195 [Halapricum sp. CBA1109]|uniref:hypothetical protein n=1 Tax=Halapricum sp. CBA1109 TaxID=2668068 RepID=UPI0012FB0CB6|nr:hypothetical protein [Halapricum sp. CBA1109]MUV88496.1 hypothetical protein [Halapricum sp. CBA1109]